jgi:hypothetical protein
VGVGRGVAGVPEATGGGRAGGGSAYSATRRASWWGVADSPQRERKASRSACISRQSWSRLSRSFSIARARTADSSAGTSGRRSAIGTNGE